MNSILIGDNIKIAPLTIEDATEMRGWGLHRNPLLFDYNFPYENDYEIKKWFRSKTFTIRNKYYSIKDKDDKLIGYMGIKNKNYLLKSSFLGIVFDPDRVSMGYGTQTLRLFLPYYFNELDMKILYLEVSEFNERAYNLYKKIGFMEDGYYLDLFSMQDLNLSSEEYKRYKSCFVFKDKKIYNYIYKMKLTKDRFFNVLARNEG
ncbi:MAG: GNAT family protein [Gudongella sp.]|nr:GNAT family protein [Gudongella sp.]